MTTWLQHNYIFIIAALLAVIFLLILILAFFLRYRRRELVPWRMARRLGELMPESYMWLHIPKLAEDSGDLDYNLAILESRLARSRRVAARNLGEIGSKRAVPHLLGHLRDPNRRVREEVARALSKILDSDSLKQLVYLLETPDWGDLNLLSYVIARFGPEAEEQIKPYLTHRSPETRAKAANIIRHIRGEPPVPPRKPLRERTIFDFLRVSAKVLLWSAFGASSLIAFLTLLISALQTTKAFTGVVLRLALFTMTLVLLLLFLNFAQRIVSDRQENRQKRLVNDYQKIIGRFLQNPLEHRRWESLKPLLHHLDLVEIACRIFSEGEIDILRREFIRQNAGDLLEKSARFSRLKWRQVQALHLLGWLLSPKYMPVLKEALDDPDQDIGFAATEALANFDSDIAYEILLDALSRERLPQSRLATFIEASSFHKAALLLAKRARDFRPKTRFWVAYLLGRTNDPSALPVLIRMSDDENADVRTRVAVALGELGDLRASPVLKKLMKDDAWPVRAHAATAVGELADKDLITDLGQLLHDSQWWVRENSALALEKIGRAAVPYLQFLLIDPDRFARNKAAEILGRLGVISEQVAKLSGPPAEAEAAREFLVAIGRAEAVNIIEEEAVTVDLETQSLLIDILAEIGDARSLPVLEHFADTGTPVIRDRARQAINRIRRAK